MEDISLHNSDFNFFTEDEPKVAEKTKGKSKFRGRRTLADISNMPQGFTGLNQGHKSGPSSDAFIKHIEQLQKEKAALSKSLAEKNKVIELCGTEVQKLRVTLEKFKQQNLQLAQSNSQMLEELRSVKERQKALTHELGCKNGLIIAKNMELEELRSVKERQKALNHELGCKNALIIAKNLELEAKEMTRMQADDINHNKVTEQEETEVCTNNGSQISKNLVHSDNTIQDDDKGKSKRLQRRRQSAKFKLDEPKPTQDSLKINSVVDDDDHDDDANDDDHDDGNTGTSSSSSSKMEDKEGDFFQDNKKPQEHRKSSVLRPVRDAAKKVQSYKEPNLVAKMRRE